MKNISLHFVVLITVLDCFNPVLAQPSPPLVSEIQAECFARHKMFLDQTDCISDVISQHAYAQPNPYTQEYLARMQLLIDKVKANALSGSEARVQLTEQLNILRQQQNEEFTLRQIQGESRANQAYDRLKDIKPMQLEVYKRQPIHMPLTTQCWQHGSQVNCSTH